MKIEFNNYIFDLGKPFDISIPIKSKGENPKAFYAPDTNISPVITDNFIGSTTEGGILNFKNIFINPHGNGTHTECLGHICTNDFTINKCLKEFHFFAQLVSIQPKKLENGDFVITEEQVSLLEIESNVTALIIRTSPNNISKSKKDWSGTNHPYIDHEAMQILVDRGINHFLIDSPSVDKEEDDGKLLAHKTFWGLLNTKTAVKGAVTIKENSKILRENCTITEMIYVPNEIKDGTFLLNIQILSIEMDASPSKIILFYPQILS